LVLSVAQFHLVLKELDEPFRTMVTLDLATGLRCSELFALKWCDVLWDDLTLLVRRGIVTGIVSDVKTKYSNAGMPLDPALAEVLLSSRGNNYFRRREDPPASSGRRQTAGPNTAATRWRGTREITPAVPARRTRAECPHPPELLRSACYRDKHYIDWPTSQVHDGGNARELPVMSRIRPLARLAFVTDCRMYV
jgi:integrase